MKNLVAVLIVVAFLGACSAYVLENTGTQQTLMPAYPAEHWDAYVQHGGAFRGR